MNSKLKKFVPNKWRNKNKSKNERFKGREKGNGRQDHIRIKNPEQGDIQRNQKP